MTGGRRIRVGLQGEVGTGGDLNQHLLLAVNQRGGVVAGDFKGVAVGDGIGRAGLDAESAENAAIVVDVVNLGVALAATDAELLGMPWILTVSPRSLAAGGVEVTERATGERSTRPIEDVEALIRGEGLPAQV